MWVPETLRTSGGLLIFVEDAAEAIVSLDLADLGRRTVGSERKGAAWPKAAVRAMMIVVTLSPCQPDQTFAIMRV